MDEQRRLKRPKITRCDDDYLPGNITEIELNNFMTFSTLTCKPASRLNLVIGPNGTGKSSLVCAIALGLCGEPQLLGRATSIGAYVKRGEESGYTKISLRGHTVEEKITIMRKIDTRNKSEWLLNGTVVPKRDIVEIIQKFNIQVNNLTQFLPQDRVCEFAKLTPVQLLEETEKAVGDPQLPIQHRALITKSQELKKFVRAVESNKGSLDQLKSLNSELERDVERVRQREELLAKVENMRKKLPWLEYDMKKAEYMEVKGQEEEARKKLEEEAKILKELKEPIEKLKQEKTVQDSKRRKFSSKLDGNANKRMQLLEDQNRLGVEVKGKYNEMEELKRQEESRQHRISKAKEDLLAAEMELSDLPSYEPPREKIEALNAQIFELEENAREIRLQKSEKERSLSQHKDMLRQCISRLKDMESTKKNRLQALQRSGADKIFEAYKWVQDHPHEFNKEVYGPVLLEVNVSNRNHADYLEGQVANYIWKSFITQDSADRDCLVKNLKSFEVPIINHVENEGRHKEKFQVTQEMQMLGINSRLDLVFDAPSAVKEVLIGQFHLEHSYIGSKETDQKANEVQRAGIMDFWTPENHYRWTTSRYGGHVSASVEAVDRSRLLLSSVDAEDMNRLNAKITDLEETISQLDENLKALQGRLRRVEDEAANLHKEREEIVKISQHERNKRRNMDNRISQLKMKLKGLEKEDDIDADLGKLADQAEELKMKQVNRVIEIKNLLIEAIACRKSYAENTMVSIELDAKIKDMEGNVKQQERSALQASEHLNYCKKQLENDRQGLVAAKRRAESIAMITPELKQAFLEMPGTIEDLNAAIQDTISQANAILFLNNNILEEYESRQRKIEDLTRKHETDEKELSKLLDEIETLKECWLPTLRTIVSQINDTFSRNFQEMAVAGEVSLDERGTDFDQYGILIKVKFRQAGQLQVLSAHHQSGGERSVSTILYLVSLQDLTNCPFRVVDEINQGMDPINERNMFQQLVRASSLPNTPQCFLLTPKLLPNLEYSEVCSILNVFNGPWIEQSSKAWSNGENWGSIGSQKGKSHC